MSSRRQHELTFPGFPRLQRDFGPLGAPWQHFARERPPWTLKAVARRWDPPRERTQLHLANAKLLLLAPSAPPTGRSASGSPRHLPGGGVAGAWGHRFFLDARLTDAVNQTRQSLILIRSV